VRSLMIAIALTLLATAASAEQVKIKWVGDYSHNSDAVYSPDNKYRSGLSKNFLNGAPEERGKVQRDGVLNAELLKPKGGSGPLPFIILMHGCTGLTRPVQKWANAKADIFLNHGYGVLILDSFTTRHVKAVCGEGNYHWGLRRAEDAYSALAYLIENKIADKDRVFVLGRSNGGTAVLQIGNALMARDHQYSFAMIFSVSPGCAGMDRSTFVRPSVIFIGDKDQANDPRKCELLEDHGPIRFVLFPGVNHGFEDKGPAYVFHGWRMEYNAKADKATIDQTLALMANPKDFKASKQ
jgi:dienelactone hydrolase